MRLAFAHDVDGVSLTLEPAARGLLARLRGRAAADLDRLPEGEQRLLFALADLRALAEERPGEVAIASDRIRLSHSAAAALDAQTADALGLPPLVDLTLATEAEGIVGSPDFRLRVEWQRAGRRELAQRTGAILQTGRGLRRLPLWMLEAVDVAESFDARARDADAWGALARFRQAVEPGAETGRDVGGRLALSDFLRGLRVRTADRFGLSPFEGQGGLDFEVVPFRSDRLAADGMPSEAEAELDGEELRAFRRRLRAQGARPAYRVGDGSFLVVDRSAAPVIETLAAMHRAPAAERAAFILNPRPKLVAAIEARLRETADWASLGETSREEALEAGLTDGFVETREFSARVTGMGRWQPPELDLARGSGTTWMPEVFGPSVTQALKTMSPAELDALRETVAASLADGRASVMVGAEQVAPSPALLAAVEGERKARRDAGLAEAQTEEATDDDGGPVVLVTADNLDAVTWRPDLRPRCTAVPTDLPGTIRTPLKPHQVESFDWALAAWRAGLPGILNADEQGLGKTLQTIAFLVWLKAHTVQASAEARGPVLVVAPTSLLRNWEEEVERHVASPGLGHLVRLYGSATGAAKRPGGGRDTDQGDERLDLGWLHEALSDGRAHRHWILTTYTTLTNYQHSLARIPFAAMVMDEIQALKNPGSLRAAAARAMRADFRIGLTGTPIENDTCDLWAVMDQIASGVLGSLREFRASYGLPDERNMAELHARVFHGQDGRPPLALRRLKEHVARDLAPKRRRLHPRVMPPMQAAAYEGAREALAQGGRGAALKMLHHIRGVSVHPSPDATGDDFVAVSARLTATMDLLSRICDHGERALVFVESLKMQHRLVELARRAFGLARIDVINGSTPIERRQEIVNRFQRHLERDEGFDLLVLGPKAAGTGLTLTAATHVIHLSRWWNPAVEEQCNDRVHRIGQRRPVTVHVPMAIHPAYRDGSFDSLLHSLMQRKRRLASAALWPMGDTEGDAEALRAAAAAAAVGPLGGDPVKQTMLALFEREGLPCPVPLADGAYEIP